MTYGFIFIVLIVMVVVAAVSVYNTTPHMTIGDIKKFGKANKFFNSARVRSAFWAVIITPIITSVILSAVAATSYSSYMDIINFEDRTYRQSYNTIVEYDNRLSINRGKQSEITDLKFQGLQQELSSLLKEHRNIVIEYNRQLINKRIMAKNLLIGCLIFDAPADKKILPFIPPGISNQ